MQTINDVHQQFAEYFGSDNIKPYAYLLSKRLKEGHICLPLEGLSVDEKMDLINIYNFKPVSIKQLSTEPLVQYKHTEKKPFVIHNNNLYLQRYFHYETLILERLKAFVESECKSSDERVDLIKAVQPFVTRLFDSKKSIEAQPDWQLTAAIIVILNNFTIITGGPGTGKTTTVAKVLAILYNINPDLKVALAAPTGKAAARMAESLKNANLDVNKIILDKFSGLVPSTIHRLLKRVYGTPNFEHNKNNPLPYDVVIIDESSMIDVAAFAKLLDAVGSETRLILLGDKDQLSSIEAGSLFGDLCLAQESLNLFSAEKIELINSFISNPSRKIPSSFIDPKNNHPLFQHIIELRHSHRFSAEKGIGKLSKAIIQNDVPVIESFLKENLHEQVEIDTNFSGKIFNDFVEGYTSYINEPNIGTAIKKLNSLRVLCAIREGTQGLYAINKRIEDLLVYRKLIKRTGEFYENRPIMVTSNNYELELFNGDVGIIRKNEKGIVMAWFEDSEGQLKAVLPGFITQLETVFAITIHKSQGSEFNNILIVLPENEDINILTRELLYTAVTRAKEKVTIQATREIILCAAEGQVKRTSGIAGRFMD